mmetsp:Transcript_24141/g.27963  ORF Transcript_24141/g.27963 Transcript_24141/m.27963 type:complete len:478 (-) Transcript_24141:154-1587(-)
MVSQLITTLRSSLKYLLWIQVILQLDAYFVLQILKEKGSDVSVSMLSLGGLKIEKPLISLLLAVISAIVVSPNADKEEVKKDKKVEPKKVAVPVKKEETKVITPTSEVIVNRVSGKSLDVVLVGCGMPKKGMGWYHLTQLLDMPNANVVAVVEPFFLNKKLCPTPPEAFAKMVESLEKAGIKCTDSVAKLPQFTKDTMCLIAGRTPDNPALFKACIAQGAKVIYLEKPGAPSVAELEEMSDWAKVKGVKVYLGYNKNVTSFVQKALALSKKHENSKVTFCHNNSYKTNDLPECFSRCSEGMLKNMAIHELALLVSFFGVTVDTIKELKVNTHKLFTESLTCWVPGTTVPNEKYITDFSRIGFTVTSQDDKKVSIMADRCGGNISFASVKDANGMEIEKFEFPDAETQIKVDKQCEEDPDMMPYFFIQSDDYFTLKDRVINSSLNKTDAEGIATIYVAIEALKLAEYFTVETNKALKK